MFVLLLSIFHLNFENERKFSAFTMWIAVRGTFIASLYDTFLNLFDFLKYPSWNVWPESRLFFFLFLSSLCLSWVVQEPAYVGTWLSSSTVPSSGCSRSTLQWLTTYSIPPAIMKPEMFEKRYCYFPLLMHRNATKVGSCTGKLLHQPEIYCAYFL